MSVRELLGVGAELFASYRPGNLQGAEIQAGISQFPPPVCTEPYCGSLHWAGKGSKVFPEYRYAPPIPFEEEAAEAKTPEDMLEKAKTDFATRGSCNSNSDKPGDWSAADWTTRTAADCPGPGGQKLDFPYIDAYPGLNAPVKKVALRQANDDLFDWTILPSAVRIPIKNQGQLSQVAGELDDWLRVKETFVVDGFKVQKGLHLLAIMPYNGGHGQIYPHIGSKKDLVNSTLSPLNLVFGGTSDMRKMEKVKPQLQIPISSPVPSEPKILDVKRLDIVLRHRDDKNDTMENTNYINFLNLQQQKQQSVDKATADANLHSSAMAPSVASSSLPFPQLSAALHFIEMRRKPRMRRNTSDTAVRRFL